jgi:hypothetical protein
VPPDLSKLLHEAWADAPEGDIVVRIHLFGIDHADGLDGVDLKALADAAGIPTSYATEIHKGMRLADYVKRR